LAIPINDRTLEKLDKMRGDLTREEFLDRLMSKQSEKEDESERGTEEESKRVEEGEWETGKEKSIDDVLEKLERIDELTEKIITLEKRQADLEDGINNTEGTMNDTPETIETEDGELVETFRFTEEEFIDDDDLIDIDDDNESSNFEFVFGCTNCNETVDEQEIVCPACGSDLGDVTSNLNWLERVGRRHEDDFVEPDDDSYNYYDETNDYIDEDYDPAPGGSPVDFEIVGRGSPDEPIRPYCNSCGGVTEYITRYDSWYCYRCNAYVDEGSVGGAEAGGAPDRSQVLERILSRRHETEKTKAAPGDKPLKYYAPYASTEVVTKISLMDDEKPSKRKRR
jgi:hypothetical protein